MSIHGQILVIKQNKHDQKSTCVQFFPNSQKIPNPNTYMGIIGNYWEVLGSI